MKKWFMVAFTVAVAFAGVVFGRSGYKSAFNSLYGTAGGNLDKCTTCHVDGQPYSVFNPYGADVKTEYNKSGNITTALQAVEDIDSDGDGDLNITEIQAGTLPGDERNSTPIEQSTWGGVKSRYQ
jgi:hypothetical protein